MEADIHTWFESDFYRILNFKCRCNDCRTSSPEYGETFTISFVRKGNFIFNVFRHALDSYSGCVLISKPGYERTVTHTHTVPDECTVFEFTGSFYRALPELFPGINFFTDGDLHSTLIKTTPELEWLHVQIMNGVLAQPVRLQTDELVMELVETVLQRITDYRPDHRINDQLKKYHLSTVENAREFIRQHFSDDISLADIAGCCHVSPFHFSRIFKVLTGYSPHRFLLHTRLKHAEMLLSGTDLPVADIAFSSGFTSIEHFSAAFRNKYRESPAKYRAEICA